MKVLVVEDDAIQRKLLRVSLDTLGYELIETSSGEEGWQFLQSEQVGLVITDWMLPGMNGLELIEKIRAADFDRYVYVILVTARDDNRDLLSGFQAGADDYIAKPFHRFELEARVRVGERILSLEQNLHQAQDKLRKLAMYDGLTGLMNRREFYARAKAELQRAVRAASSYCLVFFDIDKFKQVNDVYGHLAGDEVLKHVARVVQAAIRPYDLFGRWAGDEFICMILDLSEAQARQVAERLRQQAASSSVAVSPGAQIEPRVSVGLVYVEAAQEVDIDTLVQRADQALYEAKQDGGDKVVVVRGV